MGLSRERARIAILDDDADFCRLLHFHLKQDYHLVMAADGAELVGLIEKQAVDAIVLDVGLPEEDGISIARRIRTMSDIPLVFLSGYASADVVAIRRCFAASISARARWIFLQPVGRRGLLDRSSAGGLQ